MPESYGDHIRTKYQHELQVNIREQINRETAIRMLKDHIEKKASSGIAEFSIHFYTAKNLEVARAHRWTMFELDTKSHLINFLKNENIWHRVWAEHLQINLTKGIGE